MKDPMVIFVMLAALMARGGSNNEQVLLNSSGDKAKVLDSQHTKSETKSHPAKGPKKQSDKDDGATKKTASIDINKHEKQQHHD